jgi:hypothetical protein
VIGTDGTPVSGAQVSAYPAGSSDADLSPFSLRYASSAADGTFTITGLAASGYLIVVNTPDGLSGYYDGSTVASTESSARIVDVTAVNQDGIDVAFTGPYYTVSGSVTGSDGQPLAWASVSLQGATNSWGSTDDSGNLTISNVAAGSYLIQVSPSWGGPYIGGYWTGSGISGDPAAAAQLVVSGDMSINLVLPVAAHITGQVLYPSGLPDSQPMIDAMSGGLYEGGAMAGADGNFDVPVPDGGYQVAVGGAPGSPEMGYYAAGQAGNFSLDAALATTVAATPTGGQGLTITEPQSPQITGRLLGPDKKPLVETAVLLYRVGSTDLPSETLSDANGYFAFSADPGQYLMQVAGNGSGADIYGRGGPVGPVQASRSQTGWYAAGSRGAFSFNKSAATPVTLTAAGVSGIVIRVPQTVAIRGTVSQNNGKRLAGIVVEAVDVASGAVIANAVTAGDGTYAIIGLNSRPYVIEFVDPTGTYKTCFYSRSGTVARLNKATVLKVGLKDQSGINAKLDKARKP